MTDNSQNPGLLKRVVFGCLACVVLVLGLVVMRFDSDRTGPFLSRPANESVRRHSCGQTMKEIGISMKMYANEHDRSFPERLSDLYPEYIKDAQTFARPGTRMSLAFRNSFKEKVISPEAIDDEADYELVTRLNEDSPPDTVIVRCKTGIHPDGFHVLLANGTVDWIPSVQADR